MGRRQTETYYRAETSYLKSVLLTADEILARKDLERLSGVGAHKNEFWWGVGEKVIYKRVDFTFQRQFRFIFRD
jgi:hypothetical protein